MLQIANHYFLYSNYQQNAPEFLSENYLNGWKKFSLCNPMILIIQLSFGDVHNLKSWELYILSQEKKKIYSKGR